MRFNRFEDLVRGKKVYLSGPITGVPNYKERFDEAERLLRKYGAIVINPTVLPLGLEYAEYLKINLAMVDACQYVCMLPGWSDSRGAITEHVYGETMGKKIMYLNGLKTSRREKKI